MEKGTSPASPLFRYHATDLQGHPFEERLLLESRHGFIVLGTRRIVATRGLESADAKA